MLPFSRGRLRPQRSYTACVTIRSGGHDRIESDIAGIADTGRRASNVSPFRNVASSARYKCHKGDRICACT